MNSTASEALSDDEWQNTLVAAIIFGLGFIGISWNLLAMWIVVKNPLLKNSFGMLSFSHSIANTGVLVVFVVWAGPLTIIRSDSLAASRLGRHLGQVNILFWDACVYSHLAVSINRFIATSFPMQASRWLSTKSTMYMLSVVWCLGALHSIPYFWVDDCFIEYTPSSWTWDFAGTECGSIISTYFDYYTGITVFALIILMDLTSLYKLSANNKTVVQGSLFFYELLNFYFVYTLNDDPLFIYFTTSFAWEVCHALDGLVVVVFHFHSTFQKGGHTRTVTITNATQRSRVR